MGVVAACGTFLARWAQPSHRPPLPARPPQENQASQRGGNWNAPQPSSLGFTNERGFRLALLIAASRHVLCRFAGGANYKLRGVSFCSHLRARAHRGARSRGGLRGWGGDGHRAPEDPWWVFSESSNSFSFMRYSFLNNLANQGIRGHIQTPSVKKIGWETQKR
jgi:hypothetical protein